MVRCVLYGFMGAALWLTMAGGRAFAQSGGMFCGADDVPSAWHPLPPVIAPDQTIWAQVGSQVGSGPSRVAVVVWEDATIEDPGQRLYGRVSSPIDTYVQDVAEAGFSVVLYKFYGMTEDPSHSDAADLRADLCGLYQESGSLAGAVLIGGCPVLLWEDVDSGGRREFVSDVLIGDLDATLRDGCPGPDCVLGSSWGRAGVFDACSENPPQLEVWISRIMAGPETQTWFGMTEDELLTAYFARNHQLRSSFMIAGTDSEALLYSPGLDEYEEPILGYLDELYGESGTTLIDPSTEPPPSFNDFVHTRMPHGYQHIHIHGAEGTPYGATYVYRQCFTDSTAHPDSANPRTKSYIFEACSTCDIGHDVSYPGACLGEVVAMNPQQRLPGDDRPNGSPLIVLGASRTAYFVNIQIYYSVLPEGGCLGEGLKLLFNQDIHDLVRLGYVLIGDGTLKRAGAAEWVGTLGNSWSEAYNWSTGLVPLSMDDVLHDNADTIAMDYAPFGGIAYISDYTGDGGAGGGLMVMQSKHLELNGNGYFSNGYDVALLSGAASAPTTLTVAGSLSGGNFALDDHAALNVWGSGTPTPVSLLSGTWTVTGADASVEFAQAAADPQSVVSITLSGGAHFNVDDVQASAPFLPDGQANAIIYTSETENVFLAGNGAAGQEIYLGDRSKLRRGEALAALSLDLSCGLSIGSDFGVSDVRSDWDSTGVDVTLEATAPGAIHQKLELISPDLSTSWTVKPVLFRDVECQAAFRDLVLANVEGVGDAAGIDVVNEKDNWPGTSGSREAGFYRNVTLGTNRQMYFTTPAGVIYFYHEITCPASTRLYMDGVAVDTYTPVFKRMTLSDFGDFNGDCVLSNREMADLQSAIAGGPSRYRAFYDSNCDGVLTNVDMAKFMANYANQPPPDCGSSLLAGGEGGMEESAMSVGGEDDGVDEVEPVDVPELAAWLAEQLPAEDLAAFVAQATATAAEHADDAIGADMVELLSYLQ